MGVPHQRQVSVPIIYDGARLDYDFRIDIFAGECVVVELKAVEKVASVHEATLLTYLKLSDKRLGLMINFNVKLLNNGIKRYVL